MRSLRYTLLADGTSDRCLLRIIDWVLQESPALRGVAVDRQFAEPGSLPRTSEGLAGRVREALRLYPCDILFIHRDAERQPMEDRFAEIHQAVSKCSSPLHVCVVPVRMTEAWLLLEENTIRTAADNPNGRVSLRMPPLGDLEAEPDPKRLLDELLVAASEKNGRRLDQFRRDLPLRRRRVADLITDFTGLRRLSAFARFVQDTQQALQEWSRG